MRDTKSTCSSPLPPHLQALSQQILIKVHCVYLQEQSQPEKKQYVFGYTIRIENQSPEPVQLLNRHWVITEGDSRIKEVRGPGVVGEQPRIQPGESYTYSSGAVLDCPYGTMVGSYDMVTGDGEHFPVTVPSFLLITPNQLN